MLKNIVLAAAVLTVLVSAGQTQASFSITSPWSTYNQNFNSLPNTPRDVSLGATPIGWTNDNAAPGAGNFSIVGWYLYHPTVQAEGGFDGHQRMRIGGGNANTGAFMSYGSPATGTATPSTDRALGGLASNTTAAFPSPPAPQVNEQYLGLRLTNNTGGTLGKVTITYDGEQWRDGGAATPNAQLLTFGYKQTASGVGPLLQDTGFTPVAALDFTSPVFTNLGAGTSVDGNVAGRVNNITATITGLVWANGTDLWLRWTDLNNAGNDHGLAIDDVEVTASPIPEPASFAVWGCLAVLSMAGARYFRQ